MGEYPRTVLEFRDWFADDAACRDYLAKLRWPEGFRCPICSEPDHWVTARGLRHCQGCGRQTSVTAGTLFADTHLPLRLWFEALWHVTSQKGGASALGLQRVSGLGSYRTAWNLLHKLRRAMVRPGRDRLQGVVEVDEIFIGGPRSGKRGRGAQGKVLVMIAAQQAAKGIGRIRLTRVADASASSLEPAIAAAIELGSQVRTDNWRGYGGLDRLGYRRQIARSSAEVGENLLPLANRVASLLKRWLLGTHQGAVSATHLDYYLADRAKTQCEVPYGREGNRFSRFFPPRVVVGLEKLAALNVSRSFRTVCSMSTPSASIAEHRGRVACCSCG